MELCDRLLSILIGPIGVPRAVSSSPSGYTEDEVMGAWDIAWAAGYTEWPSTVKSA